MLSDIFIPDYIVLQLKINIVHPFISFPYAANGLNIETPKRILFPNEELENSSGKGTHSSV